MSQYRQRVYNQKINTLKEGIRRFKGKFCKRRLFAGNDTTVEISYASATRPGALWRRVEGRDEAVHVVAAIAVVAEEELILKPDKITV